MAKGKKFRYSVNRRRMWKRAKKMPAITCKPLKEAWDPRKSMEKNLADFGLSVDPNKTIPIPKARDAFMKHKALDISKMADIAPKDPAKVFVLHALEDMANVPPGRGIRISQPLLRYCVYMMETYGEDYKAMARDVKNYYQDTPNQIRKKIILFQSIPQQYDPYLKGISEKKTGEVMDTR
ncbi:nucleolar protein 16-like [Asterias amurensis]|uniref:nucleolar protein 16-like n=1 Tax=Asterias amurensis TaxID=7602 RepID=UPI003AB1E984